MKTIVLLAAVALLGGCAAPERSRMALEAAGFTDIDITGFAPWSCGDSDNFSTGFRATNPRGARVSGAVCCGLWKNCTVRF